MGVGSITNMLPNMFIIDTNFGIKLNYFHHSINTTIRFHNVKLQLQLDQC